MTDTSSDAIYDYCCNVCEEDNVNKEALFFCQQCSKGFCGKCIEKHNGLFKKHNPFGRKELDKWPAAKTAMDLLQKCQQHPDHRIELFCEDHKTLCCVLCHLHDHGACTKKMVQIEVMAKTMKQADFKQLEATIDAELHNMEKEIDMSNGCLQKLQEARDRAHEEIKLFRKKINDDFDKLERDTVQSLDTLMNTLKETLQSDIRKYSKMKEDFKYMQEAIKHVNPAKPNAHLFIAHSKSTEMDACVQTLLKETYLNRIVDITFQCNPEIEQCLLGFSDLGMVDGSNRRSHIRLPGEIIQCKEKMLQDVTHTSDRKSCQIAGILELPSGDLLLLDAVNKKLKLLDMQYKVVAHADLTYQSNDMCRISTYGVAVASFDDQTIQFLTVNNRQIVKDRTLKFEHYCVGVAHYNGSLYVATGTRLFQYTMSGRLVKELFLGPGTNTVNYIAVSADGSRIFITGMSLITLSIDGNYLSDSRVVDEPGPVSPHVSETGELLVCGFHSHSVVQMAGGVDDEEVVTLVSEKDGLSVPSCVYLSARTGRLIVGQFDDNILVIHTK